jgi:hypothetical protein
MSSAVDGASVATDSQSTFRVQHDEPRRVLARLGGDPAFGSRERRREQVWGFGPFRFRCIA